MLVLEVGKMLMRVVDEDRYVVAAGQTMAYLFYATKCITKGAEISTWCNNSEW